MRILNESKQHSARNESKQHTTHRRTCYTAHSAPTTHVRARAGREEGTQRERRERKTHTHTHTHKVRNVSKEQKTVVRVPHESLNLQLNLRVFVDNSVEAKAVMDYVASHPSQRPAPVLLCLSVCLSVSVSVSLSHSLSLSLSLTHSLSHTLSLSLPSPSSVSLCVCTHAVPFRHHPLTAGGCCSQVASTTIGSSARTTQRRSVNLPFSLRISLSFSLCHLRCHSITL